MTAEKPALPEPLRKVAESLQTRALFPVGLWENTPPEELIAAVAAVDGVLGDYPVPIFKALVTGWRRAVDEWKSATSAAAQTARDGAASNVVEKLASKLDSVGTGGAINDMGNLKTRKAYYHGVQAKNAYERHILNSVALANFPSEPVWTNAYWALTPALYACHPDLQKKASIATTLVDTIFSRVENFVQSAQAIATGGLVAWWDNHLRNFKLMLSTYVTLMRGLNEPAGDFSSAQHATAVLELVGPQVEILEDSIKVMILKMDQSQKLPPPTKDEGKPVVPFWLIYTLEQRQEAVKLHNQNREKQRIARAKERQAYRRNYEAEDEGGRGGGPHRARGGFRGRGGFPTHDPKRNRETAFLKEPMKEVEPKAL